MSSKGKRSSILKKRPSMSTGSLESSPTEATTTATARATKRIGFKPKKSVKEFFASDETATIWCNSYELSADGTPLHVTVNDTTMPVVKAESGSRQDKENVDDSSSRRNSINSSVWNLSVSVSEEEKRRMKSEVSMNSSVLNVTDRLALEPTTMVAPPPRPVLGQRQNELVPDSSAMDVSPAKAAGGRLNSPRKTIYFHPKQNMFITIDDVVSNDQHKRPAPSPNDTDINFFGPPPQSSNQPDPPGKILFQTSSTSTASSMIANPWRNKSVHTSDISAGWTSHAGIEPLSSTSQPRYTFCNSQFEISEAWNSHPAAALKLRMLQQGLEPPPDFDDPRISGGGGGGGGGSNRNSDVDTTLAITQTVAKMLQRPSGGESRTVSLDSTRASDGGVVVIEDDDEPEAMEVTCGKDTPHVDIPMQTDDDDDVFHQQPPSLDASVSDILLAPNALSRARPSFIPSTTAVPMDESYCPASPVDSKRATLANPAPMDVPAAEKQLKAVRNTVFGAQMEIAEKEEDRKPETVALPQMESVKMDLADLVFARNSIGLDLAPATVTPVDVNRPKIHRIAPRALGFNFAEGTPSSNVKQVAPPPPPRGTIYTAEIVEQTRVEDAEDRRPRKTIVQSLDVSMASPVEENLGSKGRETVFASEDVNESVQEVKKGNHLRPTMLFNEKLDVSKLEPRSGSLEDLRKYGQSRKTVLSSGDEDVIVLDSPGVTERRPVKSSHRGTLLADGDMDQTRRSPDHVIVSKSRPTTVGAVNMEHTSDISPVTVQPSRFTVYDGDRMDETRVKDLISPEIQPVATKSRQTCYNAEMDETLPIGGGVVVTKLPRKSVLQEVNMDETRGVQHPVASYQTSFDLQAMNETKVDRQDNTARSSSRTLQKSRQTNVDVQAMNETRVDGLQDAAQATNETARPSVVQQKMLQKSRPSNFVPEDMNETGVIRHNSRTLEKSRQTSFDVQSMNETKVDQQVVSRTEVADNTARSSNRMLQKSRQTSFDVQDMNETRVGGQQVDTEMLQKARQTNFGLQDANETGIIRQVDRSRMQEKSRQTSFDVQGMNETKVDQQVVSRTEVADNTARSSYRMPQKSRQTSFDVQDMNETKVGGQQVDSDLLQKSRQTNFVLQDANETGVIRQVDRSRMQEKSRQTSFDVQAMNETRVDQQVINRTEVIDDTARSSNRTLQKLRQTSFDVQDMNETRVGGQQDEMERTKLQKSRQTSFAVQDMNETTVGTGQQVVNRTEIMDNTGRTSNRTLQKSRQTSFAVQDMNETGRVSPVQDMRQTEVEMDERAWQLSRSHYSKSVQKSRQTSFAVEQMDETMAAQPVVFDGQQDETVEKSSRLQIAASKSIVDLQEQSKGMQKSRQTCYVEDHMDETVAGKSAIVENMQKSRQTNFVLQDMNETGRVSLAQNLLQNDVNMDETLSAQPGRSQFASSKSIVDPLEQSRGLQKSRHTSLAVQQMDETLAGHVKSRQTNLAVQDMNETTVGTGQQVVNRTEIMDNTAKNSNRTLQKSRQTSFAVQDMNETGRVSPAQHLPQSELEMDERSWQLSRSQFGKSTVDPLQKSRQTSFAVEQMDETLSRGHATSELVENLQKSRPTVFQEVDMDQTRRDSGNHLQVNDQNAQLSRLEHSRASRILTRQTSFAVEEMNETNVHLQKTTQLASPTANNVLKPRQTTFHQTEMDQTRCQSPALHIEETILQSPQRTDHSQAPSLFQSTNHSTVVERPRQTALFNDAPIEPTEIHSPHYNLEQSIKRHSASSTAAASSRPRHTIYCQDSMDETTVGMPRTSDGYCQLEVDEQEEQRKRTPPPPPPTVPPVAVKETMSRKTVYCEDDMEQTTVGFRLRRVAEMKPVREPSPVKERAPPPQIAIPAVPSQPIRSRQTILAPQDMEQSMMQQSMEVSVIKSTPRKGEPLTQNQHQRASPARRTIMPSENITEETFRRPVKLEQTTSPSSSDREEDYEDCSTVEMMPEKPDFSFTMPALPEDRVLRSCAVIPAYRMAPVGRIGSMTAKSLVPPEELNASDFVVPAGSRMTRIPMDELSEISGLADTSRLFRPALPVSIMAGDVSTFAIKEVTEPSILQPVVQAVPVPTPVIQETPRKTSMIPVARRSRGSIFNRQSVDMDMSGVTAMHGETPEGEEKVTVEAEEVKPEEPAVLPEPAHLNVSEEDEFYDAETNPAPEEVPPVPEHSTTMHLDVNQTAAGLKTLKFIDVDELEQTAFPQQQQQKRNLSQISKSVLLEQESDPLNMSLSEDYPLKKRKTAAPTPPVKDPLPAEDKPRKSLRRVTFQPELELETVTIKKEYDTIVEADETCASAAAAEDSRFDPSVFIVEESDMLANESNISLVASPTAQESSSSTRTARASLKYDNSIYREYGNLTLNMDQLGSTIVISDDSMTAPTTTNDQPAPIRLTLADLPKRIRKTRESLVLNSTVASEVMYEINHELSAATAKRACCSFKGNCNCQKPRRTTAAVRLETVETVREAWETNFGRILESVAAKEVAAGGEVNDLPLDERIREILARPMKEPLPLPCLERIQAGAQLPEVPSIWFLSENFLKSTLNDITSSSEVFTPCNFPATPSPTALVRNRLETQGFRWFLDSSCEATERRLYLRHRTLRTLLLVIQLQKSPTECAPEEHVRIERLELVECWRQYVPSTRLLAAHAEFMEIGPKNVRDVLSSMCTSTAHLMSLVVHLDSLVEQVLGKVDQLWRIVKNNGAVMEEFGTDRRLRISKFFEYQHEQSIHWNRLEVQFNAIDRIERSSVSFHRSNQHCESFFPTEQQCGKSGLQGLVFLECLLWNVEKCSVEC